MVSTAIQDYVNNRLVPLETLTNSRQSKFEELSGSVNEFKQRMISIRNEISSEDDAGAKVDPKDEDYHPENSSASDTDGGNASPFKTPSRRPRTTSAPIKQSTASGKFIYIHFRLITAVMSYIRYRLPLRDPFLFFSIFFSR